MLPSTMSPTPIDFEFRLGNIPVVVRGWHWLGSAVLGWDLFTAGQRGGNNLGLPLLLAWMAAVFLSILIHELGHVLAFRRFGSNGFISLELFGGLAHPTSGRGFRTWEQVAVSIAGPAIQVPLAGISYLVLKNFPLLFSGLGGRLQDVVAMFFYQMIFINLVWPLLNLLPILPLDGGRISEALFNRYSRRAVFWIDRVAVASAIVAGVLAYVTGYGSLFVYLLLIMLIAPHIQRLQQTR